MGDVRDPRSRVPRRAGGSPRHRHRLLAVARGAAPGAGRLGRALQRPRQRRLALRRGRRLPVQRLQAHAGQAGVSTHSTQLTSHCLSQD